MVNTVGSCETKFWQKKWVPIKESLKVDEEQLAIIIGSLLGDGTMRIGKGAKNANFKLEHGLAQKDYVFWKYNFLKPFVFTGPSMSYRYREGGEKYSKSWWFRTIRHPIFTEIYEQFYTGEGYRTGNKIIPKTIEKHLSPLALAVWIMDDGSYSRGQIDISTHSFSLDEVKLLQKCLEGRYGVMTTYHKDRDKGYRMFCNKRETGKLIKIILPYVIPSMEYKVGFTTP